jgi:hypothetical protein
MLITDAGTDLLTLHTALPPVDQREVDPCRDKAKKNAIVTRSDGGQDAIFILRTKKGSQQ